MTTVISRILKYGWQNFRRNRWLSIATISILLLTLTVFQGLILFRVMTETGIANLKNKIDVSIYFTSEAEEEGILTIQRRLEQQENVKQVEYISRDKALAMFKKRHEDDPTINQALRELDDNPLSASLNIKADNPSDYSGIVAFLDNQKNWQPVIEKTTYRQNQLVIERLGNIVNTAEKFGFGLTFFLSIAAILVTFNTISLAIYSNREELSVMRLMGSPNNFIVGPYVVTGIIYSVIAAVLSMVIIWPIVGFISPYLKFFVSDTSLATYYADNFLKLAGYQLVFGVTLGIVSAHVAIRKYLKI